MKRINKNKVYFYLILIGIIILIYPVIARVINKKNQSTVINQYNDKINEMDYKDLENQKQKYMEYNNRIYQDKYDIPPSIKVGEILGYINIEKINAYLPIYEGTDSKILSKGVGHIENTLLPVEDKDYHTVFVGHSGLTDRKIFDDLDKLKENDTFEINILKKSYKFVIYKIKKVLPSQTKDLMIYEEKRLVTLVTCTPKFINTHRLLIMGELQM